jgi:hypothetical protein
LLIIIKQRVLLMSHVTLADLEALSASSPPPREQTVAADEKTAQAAQSVLSNISAPRNPPPLRPRAVPVEETAVELRPVASNLEVPLLDLPVIHAAARSVIPASGSLEEMANEPIQVPS